MESLVNLAQRVNSAAQDLESYKQSQQNMPTNGVNGVNGADHGTNGVQQQNGLANGAPKDMTNPPYAKLPPNLEARRAELHDATHEIQNMTRAPGALVYEHLYRFSDIASWLFMCNFDVPCLIPLEGTVSYAELGSKLQVREAVVRRYIENLMVSGFFAESVDQPGYVHHTPDSAQLVKDPLLLKTISLLHDMMLPSITQSVGALKKWPLSQETNESGFCLANDTSDTMYQMLAKNPKMAQRFGAAMSTFTKESFTGPHPFTVDYDWNDIDGLPAATVIDLGGSLGHLSYSLARATKNIQFVVQDLPPTAEAGARQRPEDMQSRVNFEAYDFLGPQKARNEAVSAIVIANTLQNWPDKYVVQIMKNQIPVLATGSKILIYERPLPGKADPRYSRRVARTADMLMGSLLNGQLRTPDQWRDLFAEADPRFSYVASKQIGPDKSVVEVVFKE